MAGIGGTMSYDIRFCVKTEAPNNDGECYAVVHIPEYDSPTYNLRDIFAHCMGWDYRQGEYYHMPDVVVYRRRGLAELEAHPERYRKYEPGNGWGTIGSAVKCLRNWVDELTPLDELRDGMFAMDSVLWDWPLESLWWRW